MTISKKIESNGLSVPQMEHKGCSAVENKFLRYSIKFIPQQTLRGRKTVKLGFKTIGHKRLNLHLNRCPKKL